MSKLGTFCVLDGVVGTEIFSKYMDFLILDSEHGMEGLSDQRNRLNSIDRKCEAYVRVPYLSQPLIQRFLELDPDGILVPQIGGVQDAQLAVSSCLYPPKGIRGISPFTRPFSYSNENLESKKAAINSKVKICLLIEGFSGISEIEQILEELGPDIYMIYFGLYDFSNVKQCKPSWEDPELQSELKEIVGKCSLADVKVGTIANSGADIKMLKDLGIEYIVYLNDTGILSESVRKIKVNKSIE